MHNYDTDCQVSNLWTFKTPKPYKGSLRDEQGNALNGFKVQETKNTRKVSILCNGRYMRHYKFPKGLTVPKHPMNRWLNTPMCGGYGFYDEDGNCIAFNGIGKAVLEGKKPVGETLFWNKQKEECDAFIEKATRLGFEVLPKKHFFEDAYLMVMVGVNKPLKELFNLAEIAQFYAEGTGWEEFDDYLLYSFSKVENLTPAQVLQTYSWASPTSSVELIITGLCLGYAFESTLALLLE